MDSLVLRIASAAVEAVVAGLAIAGVLLLVRKIQIAVGVKDEREEHRVHPFGAR
jgi:hypothetical protein